MAVRCGKCLQVLDEEENVPPEDREPCPECGGVNRRYERSFNVTLQAVAGSLEIGGGTATLVVEPATKHDIAQPIEVHKMRPKTPPAPPRWGMFWTKDDDWLVTEYRKTEDSGDDFLYGA